MTHERKVQLVWAAMAAVLFVGAGLVADTRQTTGDMWEILPGRAFYVNYLWIRADKLQEEGKFYDAYQQAELICKLQRHFPGVWSFMAWNMAWNISVETHTPQERWRWVYNGVKLLRDQGLVYNPHSIQLYKDLGWIFLSKISGYLDDAHWVYKRQWALRMQDLLGAPPQGTTQEVIDAFAPVADESLLDKNSQRQGASVIQADKLTQILAEPNVKKYAAALEKAGIDVRIHPRDFLAQYNLWSTAPDVAAVRILPPKAEGEQDAARLAIINDPKYEAARARLLAFLRAQILWNVYRMDPAFMLELMKRYGPLDWRLPQPHGLYWELMGRKVAKEQSLEEFDVLNTQRNAFNCLKELTWRGRLTMIDLRPRRDSKDAMALEPVSTESQMQLPAIRLYQMADLRYIEPLQQAYLEQIPKQVKDAKSRFEVNQFRDGHINYLESAIEALYAAHRRAEAQKYLDYVLKNYHPMGPKWQYRSVDDFVINALRAEKKPIRDLAESQVTLATMTGYVALAMGDTATAGESLTYARRAYEAYEQGRPERLRLPPLGAYFMGLAIGLIQNPRQWGHNLTLVDRAALYRGLDDQIAMLVYPRIREFAKRACGIEGMDCEKLFPPPPGYKETDTRKLPEDTPVPEDEWPVEW